MGPSDKRIQATDRGHWCLAQRVCFHQPDGYSWQDQSNMACQGRRVGRWKQSCLEQPVHLRVQQCLLSTTHHPHLYQETEKAHNSTYAGRQVCKDTAHHWRTRNVLGYLVTKRQGTLTTDPACKTEPHRVSSKSPASYKAYTIIPPTLSLEMCN